MSHNARYKRPIKNIDDRFHDHITGYVDLLKFKIKKPVVEVSEKILSSYREKRPKNDPFANAVCPEDETGQPIMIRTVGLSKIYGKHPENALRLLEERMTKEEIQDSTQNKVGLYDVTFDVRKGELFVLMGLSGSGKSTLERCINRLIEPTSGQIIINGVEITTMNKNDMISIRRERMSMVFQNFGLLPHRDVKNNVAYGLEVRDVPEKERLNIAKKWIDLVGLSGYEDNFPKDLSGGMKQRVGLARALATDPDILFMDEAFSALDPLIRNDMQDELKRIQSELRKTIIFVTHDLDEALKLGDRIALMKDGRIIQIGTAEEILQNPADEYVSRFTREVDRTKILTAGAFMRKPRGVIYVYQGPRTALKIMEDLDRNTLLVIDSHGLLMGMVESDDVLRMVGLNDTLKDIIIKDIPKVKTDTPMKDVIQIMVTTNFPIPVVDENEILLGVVSPSVAAQTLNIGGDT